MKRLFKLAGTLLVVVALVFLVRRFLAMEIDWAQLGTPPVIAALVIAVALQTAVFVFGAYPWTVFVRALSGRDIPFSKAMPVFARANLYKYVPGNVFQYVGRNRLATDTGISHADVACATVLDILFSLAAAAVVSMLLLGRAAVGLLAQYGGRIVLIGGIGVAVLVIGGIAAWCFMRERILAYLKRYAAALAPENRPALLRGIGYYLLQNAVSAAAWLLILTLLDGSIDVAARVTLTGAFLFAWIIGFITPGAPAGIGIRESVMLLVTSETHAQTVMLFVLVTRLGSTLADLLAYAIGTVWMRTHRDPIETTNA